MYECLRFSYSFTVDAREAVKGLIEIDSNLRLLKNEEISDRFYEVGHYLFGVFVAIVHKKHN